MRRVLVLCTGNSARSQMAEGLLRHFYGDRLKVESAGTRPGTLRPEAVEAMREIDIDISAHHAKHPDIFAGQRPFDVVLSVCDSAREECPVWPAATRHIHHSFDDPAAAEGEWEVRLAAFRRVRDAIRTALPELVRRIESEP